MARTNRSNRMTTGGESYLRNTPSIMLDKNGRVLDPKKNRRDRIRELKAEFRKAQNMFNDALEIMDNVEQMFLDLETYFPDLKEPEQKK